MSYHVTVQYSHDYLQLSEMLSELDSFRRKTGSMCDCLWDNSATVTDSTALTKVRAELLTIKAQKIPMTGSEIKEFHNQVSEELPSLMREETKCYRYKYIACVVAIIYGACMLGTLHPSGSTAQQAFFWSGIPACMFGVFGAYGMKLMQQDLQKRRVTVLRELQDISAFAGRTPEVSRTISEWYSQFRATGMQVT